MPSSAALHAGTALLTGTAQTGAGGVRSLWRSAFPQAACHLSLQRLRRPALRPAMPCSRVKQGSLLPDVTVAAGRRADAAGGMGARCEAAEPQMQAFWAKLRELRAKPDSLEVAEYMGHKFQVISLGGALQFPGEGAVKHVLRRDCYRVARRAMEEIWAAQNPKTPVIISGTPGTGLTVCLYDIMFEYALHDHPILWHSWESPDILFCFGRRGVRTGSLEAFKEELQDPDAIYLCDGAVPFETSPMVRLRTVIAVSPNRLKEHFFKNLVKTAAELWLPVPSDEEMYTAAPLYCVDEALCTKLMFRWGNVPRYVLQHAHNEQQQHLLDIAIDIVRRSAKRIDDAVRDYTGADQHITKLVHIRATPDLARDGVVLGSMWIKLMLRTALMRWDTGDAARRLVEVCPGLGAGLAAGAAAAHQVVAHRAFQRGGLFLLRNHQGQQSVIRLPELQVVDVSSSQQAGELASYWEASPAFLRRPSLYALASRPSFATVDAAVILDPACLAALPAMAATGSAGVRALVFGVQITTNCSHKINYAGWQSFSSATGARTLAFAVPLRSWLTHPPQEFEGGPVDAAQQVPCDQQVISWVPVTAGELDNLSLDGLRELGKAYGIDYAHRLPREVLVRRLLEAEVPTEDLSILEAALEEVCTTAVAAGRVARALHAAGLTVVDGKVQQTVSLEQRFTRTQVRAWSETWLKQMCSCYDVRTTDDDDEELCMEDQQELFISTLYIGYPY